MDDSIFASILAFDLSKSTLHSGLRCFSLIDLPKSTYLATKLFIASIPVTMLGDGYKNIGNLEIPQEKLEILWKSLEIYEIP